jgi:hypothetical protein
MRNAKCSHFPQFRTKTKKFNLINSLNFFFGSKRNAKAHIFPRLERKQIRTAQPSYILSRSLHSIRSCYTLGLYLRKQCDTFKGTSTAGVFILTFFFCFEEMKRHWCTRRKIIVRGQSYGWRLPKYCPPIPLTARRVCTPTPLVRGEDTLARGRGGGGSIFWKTSDTALYST